MHENNLEAHRVRIIYLKSKIEYTKYLTKRFQNEDTLNLLANHMRDCMDLYLKVLHENKK